MYSSRRGVFRYDKNRQWFYGSPVAAMGIFDYRPWPGKVKVARKEQAMGKLTRSRNPVNSPKVYPRRHRPITPSFQVLRRYVSRRSDWPRGKWLYYIRDNGARDCFPVERQCVPEPLRSLLVDVPFMAHRSDLEPFAYFKTRQDANRVAIALQILYA
jgi:hypothetical protein